MRFSITVLILALLFVPLVSTRTLANPQSQTATTQHDRDVNGMSAIITLRNFNTAQVTYATKLGNGNYADKMTLLGEGPGGLGFLHDSVIQMQSKPKLGYVLTEIQTSPKIGTIESTYFVVAYPAIKTGPNRTGDDCFYVDDSGVIRHSGSPTEFPNQHSEPLADNIFKTDSYDNLIKEVMQRGLKEIEANAPSKNN